MPEIIQRHKSILRQDMQYYVSTMMMPSSLENSYSSGDTRAYE